MVKRLPRAIHEAFRPDMPLARRLLQDHMRLSNPLIEAICLFSLGNLTALEKAPSFEAFDAMANILNLIALAISERSDLLHYFRVLQSAALAMEDVRKRSEKLGRVEIRAIEFENIRNAIVRFEEILPFITYRALKVSYLTLARK